MLHNIESPYRAPAVRFFQRKNVRKKKEKERKGAPERKKEREKERYEQWETETFKVFQRITRKSYHRKRISPRSYSRRQEVPESRERSFELPSGTYLSSSVIRLNFARCDTRGVRHFSKREGRLFSRKITSLCIVSTFTANEIMHERAQDGLAERQRARPRVRIYGTKIATAARKLSF